MPNPPRRRPAPKSNAIVWIVVASLAAVVVLGGAVSVGAYFLLRGKTAAVGPPGPGGAALDSNSVENTSAWAEGAVKRIKAAESSGGAAAADAEVARVEKEVRDALVGKKVRWTFPVEAVDEGEVKIDTFFGKPAGKYEGADPALKGKPLRRVYFRVYFADDKDNVKVGDEVTQAKAALLNKGDRVAVTRTVTKVEVRKHDPWFMQSFYTKVVDDLEPFCIDVTVERK